MQISSDTRIRLLLCCSCTLCAWAADPNHWWICHRWPMQWYEHEMMMCLQWVLTCIYWGWLSIGWPHQRQPNTAKPSLCQHQTAIMRQSMCPPQTKRHLWHSTQTPMRSLPHPHRNLQKIASSKSSLSTLTCVTTCSFCLPLYIKVICEVKLTSQ